MPPRRRPKSSTGWLGVRLRLRQSSRYAAEITVDGVRWWLGTFPSLEKSARAYNFAAWTFGRPRGKMNFPETENLAEAEFLSPVVRMVTCEQEKENRRAFLQLRAHESDEAAMEKMSRDHPELVQYELEFFAAREAAKKKKEEEDEAGPSTIVISSGSELSLDFWSGSSDDDDLDDF